jgi:hypothetical protein
MTTSASTSAHLEQRQRTTGERGALASDPTRQAYEILRLGFTVAPILAGADKFFHLLTDWDQYVAPPVARILGGATHDAMMVVGVIEIAAGVLVATRPKIGAYVVAAWLVGIILDLLLCGRFFDIALRDLGLSLGALALGRLATVFAGKTHLAS